MCSSSPLSLMLFGIYLLCFFQKRMFVNCACVCVNCRNMYKSVLHVLSTQAIKQYRSVPENRHEVQPHFTPIRALFVKETQFNLLLYEHARSVLAAKGVCMCSVLYGEEGGHTIIEGAPPYNGFP